MTEGQSTTSTDSDRLQQVIDAILEQLRQGQPPAVESLMEAHPELASEIRDVVSTLAVVEFLKPNAQDVDATASDQSCLDESPPPEIPDYQVVREVDRGGMGIVYDAIQTRLDRRVALKVLPRGFLDNEKMRQRFEIETRAAARLQHPRIVPVFDAGTHDGINYYAMQFVEGLNLKSVISNVSGLRSQTSTPTHQEPGSVKSLVLIGALVATQNFADTVTRVDLGQLERSNSIPVNGPSPSQGLIPARMQRPGQSGLLLKNYFRNVSRLLQEVAEALAFAHEQGVVHRDVKPSNIILDYRGRPWLTDFGLAKTDDDDVTRTGDVVGTLRYLAPERIRGVSNFSGDVYALGATLYELITLRPMIRASDPGQALNEILTRAPIPPRRLDPQIPVDLETIILKAVAKDSDERYLSAAEFADDLQRFCEGRSVLARPVSPVTRTWRWSKRNPLLAGSFAALLLLMVATTVGSIVAAIQFQVLAARESESRRAAEVAEAATSEALANEQQARQQETQQREFAQAINDFVIDDLLALTSIEGQFRFDPTGIPLGQNATIDDLLNRAASKLKSRDDLDPRSRAELNWIVGVSYRASGDLVQAIEFLREAVRLFEQSTGPQSVDFVNAQNSLAAALSANGEYRESRQLLTNVWEHAVQANGPDDIEALLAKFRIDLGRAAVGDFETAIPAMRQSAEKIEQLLEPAHNETLYAWGNLATALRSAGQPIEADQICQRALDLAEQIKGPTHPDTIDLLMRQVDIKTALEDNKLALELAQKLQQRMVELYGNDNPFTMGAGVTVGTCFRKLGQLDQAITTISDHRQELERRLGKLHPAVAVATRELANAYKDQGDFKTALELMEQAIDTMSKVFSHSQPERLRARLDRVNLLVELDQTDASIDEALDLLKLMTANWGPRHPDVITCLNHLGLAYEDQSDLDQAENYLTRALEAIDRKSFPEYFATTSNNLARVHLARQDPQPAIDLLVAATEAIENVLPPDHRTRVVCQSTLAAAYQQNGNLQRALEIWKKSLATFEKTIGTNHPDYLETQNNLAFGYMKTGNFELAIPMLQAALAKVEATDQPPSIRFLLLNNLSAALRETGQVDQGIAYLEQATRLSEQHFGPTHPQTLFYLRNLGVAYYNQEQFEQAIVTFTTARDASQKRFGADHPQTLRLAGNLGINLLSAGRIDEAVETLTPVEAAAADEPRLSFARLSLFKALVQKRETKLADAVGQRLVTQYENSDLEPKSLAEKLDNVAAMAAEVDGWKLAAQCLARATSLYQTAGETELMQACQKRLAEIQAAHPEVVQ